MSTSTPIVKCEKGKKKRAAPLSTPNFAKIGTKANLNADNKTKYIPVRVFAFLLFTLMSYENSLLSANPRPLQT